MELYDCILRTKEKIKLFYEYNIDFILKELDVKKRLVLVGSGSSFNVLRLAVYKLGLEDKVTFYTPSDFYFKDIDNHNVLVLSQSGKTKKIIDCMKKNKDNTYIAVTYSNISEIAKIADYKLEILCEDEEYIFRTLGVNCSYILLIKILSHYFKLFANCYFIEQLKLLEYNFDNIVDKYNKNKKVFLEKMKNKEMVFISGEANYQYLCSEIAIKFSEMIPVFTSSYELEELVHGYQNSFNIKSLIILIEKQELKKSESIHNFISKEISKDSVISFKLDIDLKLSSKLFEELEILIYFQMFSYFIAVSRNRDLTKSIYPQLNKYFKKQV